MPADGRSEPGGDYVSDDIGLGQVAGHGRDSFRCCATGWAGRVCLRGELGGSGARYQVAGRNIDNWEIMRRWADVLDHRHQPGRRHCVQAATAHFYADEPSSERSSPARPDTRRATLSNHASLAFGVAHGSVQPFRIAYGAASALAWAAGA
jgi:hypothetical protein